MQNMYPVHAQTANAHSHLGIRCPLTEALDVTDCMKGEQMPG